MLATRLVGATSAAAGIQYVGGYVQGFLGTTSDVTISLTSLTGGLASAPAAGDLVIVYFGTGSTTGRAIAVSGYTQIEKLVAPDTFDTNLVVARKFMGATPDTSFVLTGGTLNTSDAGAVAVQVWRGVDAASPFNTTPAEATGTSSVLCNPPSINGAIIIAGGAGAHNAGTQTYSSSDLTDFRSVGSNDTNDVTIGLGYRDGPYQTFNPAAFTFSGSNSTSFSWAAVTLALRPA